jgi:predicted amidophosphoribosyltransferase
MKLMCRLFGHEPSLSRVQRDPQTFEEYTVCRRCGVPLVHDAQSWKECEKEALISIIADAKYRRNGESLANMEVIRTISVND